MYCAVPSPCSLLYCWCSPCSAQRLEHARSACSLIRPGPAGIPHTYASEERALGRNDRNGATSTRVDRCMTGALPAVVSCRVVSCGFTATPVSTTSRGGQEEEEPSGGGRAYSPTPIFNSAIMACTPPSACDTDVIDLCDSWSTRQCQPAAETKRNEKKRKEARKIWELLA